LAPKVAVAAVIPEARLPDVAVAGRRNHLVARRRRRDVEVDAYGSGSRQRRDTDRGHREGGKQQFAFDHWVPPVEFRGPTHVNARALAANARHSPISGSALSDTV